MFPHNACSHWKWMTGVRFGMISSVRYFIISIAMAVLAATLTAQLFGPALTSSFHALCFILSSGFHFCMDFIFWRLFVVLEWCKTTAHSRCWIRLSLGLNSSPLGLFLTAHMSSKAALQRNCRQVHVVLSYWQYFYSGGALPRTQSYFWLAMFSISLYNRHAL